MSVREVFLNPADARLRAGWRMAVFFAAFALVNAAGLAAIVPLLTIAGIVRSSLLMMTIIYVMLIGVTWAVCAWLEHRPLRSVGFGLHDRTVVELAQGVGLGMLMMTFIFVVNVSFGLASFSIKALTFQQIAAITSYSIAEFTVVAVGEELLFRGYVFQTLAEGTSKIIAVAIFAVFFAFVHMSNPNATALSLMNIALAGVWLSAAYFKTRGLWLPIGLHFSWNFFQNHVYSFPVSGLTMHETQLGVLYDNGPAWLTGGTFGPEGGVLATVVIVAGTAAIWYMPQFRASASAWTADTVPTGDSPQMAGVPHVPSTDNPV